MVFRNPAFHIIFISSMVFLIVNVIENIVYYSIGRNPDKNHIPIEIPSHYDFRKIILITIVFALLQGLLTWAFD